MNVGENISSRKVLATGAAERVNSFKLNKDSENADTRRTSFLIPGINCSARCLEDLPRNRSRLNSSSSTLLSLSSVPRTVTPIRSTSVASSINDSASSSQQSSVYYIPGITEKSRFLMQSNQSPTTSLSSSSPLVSSTSDAQQPVVEKTGIKKRKKKKKISKSHKKKSSKKTKKKKKEGSTVEEEEALFSDTDATPSCSNVTSHLRRSLTRSTSTRRSLSLSRSPSYRIREHREFAKKQKQKQKQKQSGEKRGFPDSESKIHSSSNYAISSSCNRPPPVSVATTTRPPLGPSLLSKRNPYSGGERRRPSISNIPKQERPLRRSSRSLDLFLERPSSSTRRSSSPDLVAAAGWAPAAKNSPLEYHFCREIEQRIKQLTEESQQLLNSIPDDLLEASGNDDLGSYPKKQLKEKTREKRSSSNSRRSERSENSTKLSKSKSERGRKSKSDERSEKDCVNNHTSRLNRSRSSSKIRKNDSSSGTSPKSKKRSSSRTRSKNGKKTPSNKKGIILDGTEVSECLLKTTAQETISLPPPPTKSKSDNLIVSLDSGSGILRNTQSIISRTDLLKMETKRIRKLRKQRPERQVLGKGGKREPHYLSDDTDDRRERDHHDHDGAGRRHRRVKGRSNNLTRRSVSMPKASRASSP